MNGLSRVDIATQMPDSIIASELLAATPSSTFARTADQRSRREGADMSTICVEVIIRRP